MWRNMSTWKDMGGREGVRCIDPVEKENSVLRRNEQDTRACESDFLAWTSLSKANYLALGLGIAGELSSPESLGLPLS